MKRFMELARGLGILFMVVLGLGQCQRDNDMYDPLISGGEFWLVFVLLAIITFLADRYLKKEYVDDLKKKGYEFPDDFDPDI